jgi:hypothetical protein
MKKLFSLTLLMLFSGAAIFAQQGMGNQKRTYPHTTVTNGNLKITYGQPTRNGRELFGADIPYKKIWAPGADEATQVTFKKDFILNGRTEVKAGTYTLFIQPDCKSEWTFFLNKRLNVPCDIDYNLIRDEKVAGSCVGTKQLDHNVESLTIVPQENGFSVEWGQTSAFFSVIWE